MTMTTTKATGSTVAQKRRTSRLRRHVRLRKKIRGTAARPRLVVTRSTRHMYAQVVDDVRGVTLASASTYGLEVGGDKTAAAKRVGELVAERAKAAGVNAVVFDRGGDKYHGRIAALADAARENGLDF